MSGTLGTYALAMATIGPGAPYPTLLASIAVAIVVGTALTLRIQELPVTRGLALEQVAREHTALPNGYKPTLWLALVTFTITPLAEGLVNVQLEPWLIARYGALPAIFYAVEFAGAAAAIALLAYIVILQRRRPWNVAALIVPAGLVGAAFYPAIAWLAPDLGAYAAWNAAKVAAGAFAVLGMERALMDVVKGARKGATFQLFVLFMVAGTFGGQMLGAALGKAMGMEWLLVLAGCIIAGAVALYAIVLAPRLKEA